MAAPRALYITFSILYLITLAIVLWFLLYYSGVPSWVWIFFAILIAIISLIMREVAIKNVVSSSGKPKSTGLGVWGVLYILLQIIALILVIIGLIFVIMYSTIPWWVWVILGSAIVLAMIAVIIAIIPGVGPIIALILLIIAFIAYIVGLILLVIYSDAPWWIWLIIGVMILFGILASIFEGLSERPKVVVVDECSTSTTTSCAVIEKSVSTPGTINVDLLPASNIPEQIIFN